MDGALASESKGCRRRSDVGRKGVVVPGHASQAVEGGDEDDSPHRPGGGKPYRDPAAEAPSEHHDAVRVHVLARGEPVVDEECIRGERGLARPPLAPPRSRGS